MKHIAALLLFAVSVVTYAQQNIYIYKNGTYTVKALTEGVEINPDEADSITFRQPIEQKHVSITYDASGAQVVVPSSVKGVTYTVKGADVVITSTNDTQEITYVAKGTSTNGSLTINGIYKLTLELQGLNLTSTASAPIDIQCGKRVALVLADGTTNTLTDSPASTSKAALYCKGHLEIEGAGTLNVTGKANHAIASKEYLQLKRTTGAINILASANDAIHAGQYFQMSGGQVTISDHTVGDGIQVEQTTDPTDENNGEMIIKGGKIDITMTSEDTKALKADSHVTISGGTLTLNANGNGSRGIQTDGNLTIGEEDSATTITITAAGGKCTLPEDAADPHKSTGIKVKGNMTVNAGTITVYNTGKKANGIKVDGEYVKNGGVVVGSF